MTNPYSRRTNLEARLDELRDQIGELLRKMETAVGSEAEALGPRLEAAQKKLRELKETSKDAWNDLKPGLDKAWDELHASLTQAASRFKSRHDQ